MCKDAWRAVGKTKWRGTTVVVTNNMRIDMAIMMETFWMIWNKEKSCQDYTKEELTKVKATERTNNGTTVRRG